MERTTFRLSFTTEISRSTPVKIEVRIIKIIYLYKNVHIFDCRPLKLASILFWSSKAIKNLNFVDVLVINSHNPNITALSIVPSGGYKPINFTLDDGTEVSYSCSVQWHNHLYVFGGYVKIRQVSMVNGKRLERKKDLGFNFYDGGCAVLNQRTIVLCFGGQDESNVCRQSNNPVGSFTKLPSSNHLHLNTRIASFDGEIICLNFF